MEHDALTAPGGDNSGRITNWRDFEDRFRASMAVAATHGADLTLVDTDFVHWPLGQRSVMEAFHQWGLLSRSTHCRLLAAHFDAFPRQHPLWVTWHTTWAHRVQCWQAPDELVPALMPTLVLHGTIGLRLHEPLHGIGVWTRDLGTLTEWLSEIDVILQRSEQALPPTTVGL